MRRWRIPSLLSEVSCSMVIASPLLSQQIRLSSISFDPLDNPSADKVIKVEEQPMRSPNAATLMTPADRAIEEPEAPFSIRRRQRGGRWVVAVSSSVSAVDALRARIRAQSKTVAEHIATDPQAKAFIDDWATPESVTR